MIRPLMLLGLILSVWAPPAQAAVEARGRVEGVVESFNSFTVKLRLDHGRTVTVQRASIPRSEALREGIRVVAYPKAAEFEGFAPKKSKSR